MKIMKSHSDVYHLIDDWGQAIASIHTLETALLVKALADGQSLTQDERQKAFDAVRQYDSQTAVRVERVKARRKRRKQRTNEIDISAVVEEVDNALKEETAP